MTIPTREEALKALDKLSSDYDLAGGWSPDPMPLLATLRSYIESHTGEVVGVAGEMPGSNGGFTMAAFEADKIPVGTKIYASPVQPDHIADVGKMICPRSANGRPEGFTVRECVAAGECGCGESVTPGSTVRTSPVQPVKLEWAGNALTHNGGVIGRVKPAQKFDWTCQDGPPWAYAGIWSKTYTQVDTEEFGRAMLEKEARQWLSGGDK